VFLRIWSGFKTGSAALVLVLVALYTTPLVPATAQWLTGDWEDAKGDVLIVLGGSQLEDGTLGVESYWRSVYTWWAWRSGGFQRLVISGGPEGGKRPVSASMADFVVALGVPRDRILLETQSRSTRQNAVMTAELLKGIEGTRVLLTSDIHMRRARAAFARAGVVTVPAPIPDFRKRWQSWIGRWSCIWDVAVGLAKYMYYAVRGWV
jgi:uncharacterized SAM-binding protein YcdF (DUF218 family)